MIEPAKFLLFIGVSWALIIAPGPDMIYVITRAMAHGRRAGVLSAVGVVCGILVHTIAAAFGLTLILQTSAFAFLFVKFAGAAYLIYLGIRAWLDKSPFTLETTASAVTPHALFWQGVLSNVLNPKIAIFFLAFLPQFVDPARGPAALQLVILGILLVVIAAASDTCYALLTGSASAWLRRRAHLLRRGRLVTGGAYITLGLAAAVAGERPKPS